MGALRRERGGAALARFARPGGPSRRQDRLPGCCATTAYRHTKGSRSCWRSLSRESGATPMLAPPFGRAWDDCAIRARTISIGGARHSPGAVESFPIASQKYEGGRFRRYVDGRKPTTERVRRGIAAALTRRPRIRYDFAGRCCPSPTGRRYATPSKAARNGSESGASVALTTFQTGYCCSRQTRLSVRRSSLASGRYGASERSRLTALAGRMRSVVFRHTPTDVAGPPTTANAVCARRPRDSVMSTVTNADSGPPGGRRGKARSL